MGTDGGHGPQNAAPDGALDKYAKIYEGRSLAYSKFNDVLRRIGLKEIFAHIQCRDGRLCELGCADGTETRLLAKYAKHQLVVVDGSAENIARACVEVPQAIPVHTMWETFLPEQPFAEVVFRCGLEHVSNPRPLLEHLRKHVVAPGGQLHVIVPNGLSVHRLIGVALGALRAPTDFSDGDRLLGHETVFTLEHLRRLLDETGWHVRDIVGVGMKTMANAQMEDIPASVIDALTVLGRLQPRFAAEIYAVVTPT